MLVIGELANFAGVSTRTIRFYHQQGLLPEPARDTSGYRRYKAADVVRLTRIVALAAAGVPLTRIAEALEAKPEHFAAELAKVDEQLRAKMRRLRALRTKLADLDSPDRLALPAAIVDFIKELRSVDVPARYVDALRDSWVLNYAAHPETTERFLAEAKFFEDDAYLDLTKRMMRLADVDPEDPRITRLADDARAWITSHPVRTVLDRYAELENSRTVDLVNSLVPTTPAIQRLAELINDDGVRLGTVRETVDPGLV